MGIPNGRRQRAKLIGNARWAAYAAAGAATAAVGVNSAEADIYYSGILNQSFNDTNTATNVAVADGFTLVPSAAGFSLLHNLVGGGNGFAGFFVGGAVSAAFAGTINPATTSYRYPFKLGPNLAVSAQDFVTHFNNGMVSFSATLAFGNGVGPALSEWRQAGSGYIGFRFDAGSGVQYGWVQLSMNGSPGNSFTLIDYAWGDPGTALMTGQIPEPGSLGLLALGAVGLLLWRKQRANSGTEA